MGEYLKYNNPHKTSLYIRCHLPVIIWNQAALAPFARQQGIGLCVDSLRDIAPTLAVLTPERYAEMRGRVEELSRSWPKAISSAPPFSGLSTICGKGGRSPWG